MKILLLGSGGREHAIVNSLLAENTNHQITVSPGNAGIAKRVQTTPLEILSPELVTEYAVANGIELVIVGPEAPLVSGVADALRAKNIPVFGPNRNAAAIESSKSFAKNIMHRANVPTGRAKQASKLSEVIDALAEYGSPYVIKADGPAAGKGVLVTTDYSAALSHAKHYLLQGSVLVEEHLSGTEVSLFFLSDGHNLLALSPAQDYKRAYDGDTGPNTGGMGAYSPLPWLTRQWGSEKTFIDMVANRIALPVIRALEAEQTPFVGLLYCGLILGETLDDFRVIEFNARFGDPETQTILPRLKTPLSALLYAAATGNLAETPPPVFSEDATVTVVLASEGYPGEPQTARRLSGLANAAAIPGISITHAATVQDREHYLANGGRVLGVTGSGKTIRDARESAYAALGHIQLSGGHYRSDIAYGVGDE